MILLSFAFSVVAAICMLYTSVYDDYISGHRLTLPWSDENTTCPSGGSIKGHCMEATEVLSFGDRWSLRSLERKAESQGITIRQLWKNLENDSEAQQLAKGYSAHEVAMFQDLLAVAKAPALMEKEKEEEKARDEAKLKATWKREKEMLEAKSNEKKAEEIAELKKKKKEEEEEKRKEEEGKKEEEKKKEEGEGYKAGQKMKDIGSTAEEIMAATKKEDQTREKAGPKIVSTTATTAAVILLLFTSLALVRLVRVLKGQENAILALQSLVLEAHLQATEDRAHAATERVVAAEELKRFAKQLTDIVRADFKLQLRNEVKLAVASAMIDLSPDGDYFDDDHFDDGHFSDDHFATSPNRGADPCASRPRVSGPSKAAHGIKRFEIDVSEAPVYTARKSPPLKSPVVKLPAKSPITPDLYGFRRTSGDGTLTTTTDDILDESMSESMSEPMTGSMGESGTDTTGHAIRASDSVDAHGIVRAGYTMTLPASKKLKGEQGKNAGEEKKNTETETETDTKTKPKARTKMKEKNVSSPSERTKESWKGGTEERLFTRSCDPPRIDRSEDSLDRRLPSPRTPRAKASSYTFPPPCPWPSLSPSPLDTPEVAREPNSELTLTEPFTLTTDSIWPLPAHSRFPRLEKNSPSYPNTNFSGRQLPQPHFDSDPHFGSEPQTLVDLESGNSGNKIEKKGDQVGDEVGDGRHPDWPYRTPPAHLRPELSWLFELTPPPPPLPSPDPASPDLESQRWPAAPLEGKRWCRPSLPPVVHPTEQRPSPWTPTHLLPSFNPQPSNPSSDSSQERGGKALAASWGPTHTQAPLRTPTSALPLRLTETVSAPLAEDIGHRLSSWPPSTRPSTQNLTPSLGKSPPRRKLQSRPDLVPETLPLTSPEAKSGVESKVESKVESRTVPEQSRQLERQLARKPGPPIDDCPEPFSGRE